MRLYSCLIHYKKIIIKLSYLILYISFPISCIPFNLSNNHAFSYTDQIFFLGRANTKNFQITCEEILQFYGYYIDTYQNDQLSSQVTTKWRVRDPYESESRTGFLEAKTRIVIKGEIISNTFTRNNGYTYNCFLLYENVGYKNNRYVLINDTPELKLDLQVIVNHLKDKYSNMDFR